MIRPKKVVEVNPELKAFVPSNLRVKRQAPKTRKPSAAAARTLAMRPSKPLHQQPQPQGSKGAGGAPAVGGGGAASGGGGDDFDAFMAEMKGLGAIAS